MEYQRGWDRPLFFVRGRSSYDRWLKPKELCALAGLLLGSGSVCSEVIIFLLMMISGLSVL